LGNSPTSPPRRKTPGICAKADAGSSIGRLSRCAFVMCAPEVRGAVLAVVSRRVESGVCAWRRTGTTRAENARTRVRTTDRSELWMRDDWQNCANFLPGCAQLEPGEPNAEAESPCGI